MENFSTPRHRLLPWVANLATVAVVLAATVWSGAQRPADRDVSLAQAPKTQHVAEQSPAIVPAKGANTPAWPAPGPVVSRETLQSVGYLPGPLR